MSGSRCCVLLLTVVGLGLACVSPHRALAQSRRLDNEKTSLDELDTKAVPTLPGSVRTPLTAFESPVDPEEYFLEPTRFVHVDRHA
jgi:hypothetical protein